MLDIIIFTISDHKCQLMFPLLKCCNSTLKMGNENLAHRQLSLLCNQQSRHRPSNLLLFQLLTRHMFLTECIVFCLLSKSKKKVFLFPIKMSIVPSIFFCCNNCLEIWNSSFRMRVEGDGIA